MMELAAIAQADFGDWIETIIVLVIVLGGVLQGIGKAIVKKMTVKKEADASKRGNPPHPGQTSQQGRRLAPRSQPDRPVARPAQPETSGHRHPSQMHAPRPVAPFVLGAPPIARRPDAATPVARPVAPPKKTRRSALPSSEGLRQREPQNMLARRSEREQPSEKKRETVAEHHLQLSDEVAHPSTAAEYHERPPSRNRLPKLTRSSLRDAIILREILGPPVALRDSSDCY